MPSTIFILPYANNGKSKINDTLVCSDKKSLFFKLCDAAEVQLSHLMEAGVPRMEAVDELVYRYEGQLTTVSYNNYGGHSMNNQDIRVFFKYEEVMIITNCNDGRVIEYMIDPIAFGNKCGSKEGN